MNILWEHAHRLRSKGTNYHEKDVLELKAQTYFFFVVNEILLKQKDAQPLMFALETGMISLYAHLPINWRPRPRDEGRRIRILQR